MNSLRRLGVLNAAELDSGPQTRIKFGNTAP